MHRSVICGFVRRQDAVQCCSVKDIWIFLGTDAFILRIAVVINSSLEGAGRCISMCGRDRPRPKQLEMTNALGIVAGGFGLPLIWRIKADTPPQRWSGCPRSPEQVALRIVPDSPGTMLTLKAACPWSSV